MKKEDTSIRSQVKNIRLQEKKNYQTNKIYIGNLEYPTSGDDSYGEKINKTELYYFFELIYIDECEKKNLYRELFTNYLICDKFSESDTPYLCDIKPLNEVIPNLPDEISNLDLLFILDQVNQKVKMDQLVDKSLAKLKKKQAK